MPKPTALLSQILLYLALMPLAGAGVVVLPDDYLAGVHAAEWVFIGSNYKCELRHEITGFGIGRFQRLAGEDLTFRIDSFQRVPIRVDAFLREVSPSWVHAEPDPLTQSVHIEPGMTPVRLTRKPAAWMLSSLAKGQIDSFDFFDWDDERKPVHVRLSPVNYQTPYDKFRLCLQEMSDQGFDAYRETLVHFPYDVYELDPSAKSLLDALAGYLVADNSIEQIKIAGHADDRGTLRYNQKLSARRAESVYDYLVQGGVRPVLMRRAAYGESKPRQAGRSERARAANRRTEISIYR